jgi:hypothetical protein
LHFADRAEAYLDLPKAPKQFLKEVPVTWDETHFIAGYPGQFVILARRHGQRSYLGGINGSDRPRKEKVALPPWLGTGEHELTLIRDGATAHSLSTDRRTVRSREALEINFQPFGGFVAVIR